MKIDLNIHKRYRYVLFSGLYIAEGLYQALILIVTPLYLLEKNVSLPIITLVAGIGYLPWGLKFVWGGVIDYYHRYGRKRFAVFGTIFGSAGFLILSIVDQFFSIVFFTIFLLFGYVGIGFLDAATDAWAIDISIKEERGKINGSMIIGKWVGQYLGALFIIVLGLNFGYSISFLLSGILVFTMVLIPLTIKYEERKVGEFRVWSLIKAEFRKTVTRMTVVYFFVIVLQHALYSTMLVLYLKTIVNLDDIVVGLLFALWLIAVIPGSIVAGFLSDRYGRKKPLYMFLIGLLIVSVLPVFITDHFLLIINFSLFMFFMNGVATGNWAMVMDVINPKISASEHEVICSIVNFGSIVIGSATGALIVWFGYNNLFLLAGLIVFVSLVLLTRIRGLNMIVWRDYER